MGLFRYFKYFKIFYGFLLIKLLHSIHGTFSDVIGLVFRAMCFQLGLIFLKINSALLRSHCTNNPKTVAFSIFFFDKFYKAFFVLTLTCVMIFRVVKHF